MLISAWWNEIEARISAFLAAILDAEAETVVTVYLALQNDGAKKAMIDTIASMKLTPPELTTFQEVQRTIGKRYSDRNNAVHGAWGVSETYPDALLWSDIREVTLLHTRMMGLKGPECFMSRQNLMLEQQAKFMIWKPIIYLTKEAASLR
jgi:hypothetical protein